VQLIVGDVPDMTFDVPPTLPRLWATPIGCGS
jgi:hypothetical protein